MHPASCASARALAVVRGGILGLAAALWLVAAPAAAADAPSKSGSDATVTITPFPPSVQVDSGVAADKDEASDASGKRSKRGRRHYDISADPDFESFSNAMETAPWLVGLVFLVVGSIFLTPVILLIGIIWYKLRKTRLQNEALLKLAEKGVMPPAQAVAAVVSGATPMQTAAATGAEAGGQAAAAIHEQVVVARKRAVWSDLRKGVVMITVGLALCLYSITEDASANWIGLVLLFLGIGYVVLWWLEDRHIERSNASSSGAGGGS